MKKAKKIAENFKLEINTLQHEYNKIVVETGGTKRTLYGEWAEALAHQNLTESVNDF